MVTNAKRFWLFEGDFAFLVGRQTEFPDAVGLSGWDDAAG